MKDSFSSFPECLLAHSSHLHFLFTCCIIFSLNRLLSGGALYFAGNALTMDHCTFINCSSPHKDGGGGSFYVIDAQSVIMNNVKITNGSAYLAGGGLLRDCGDVHLNSVEVEECSSCVGAAFVFTRCEAVYMDKVSVMHSTSPAHYTSCSQIRGAVVVTETEKLRVRQSKFVDNAVDISKRMLTTLISGGALVGERVRDVIIIDTEFKGNSFRSVLVPSASSYGGAAFTMDDVSSVSVLRTKFERNVALNPQTARFAASENADNVDAMWSADYERLLFPSFYHSAPRNVSSTTATTPSLYSSSLPFSFYPPSTTTVGGAIYLHRTNESDFSYTLFSCNECVGDNSTFGGSAEGGAIRGMHLGTLRISFSKFEGNKATGGSSTQHHPMGECGVRMALNLFMIVLIVAVNENRWC